MTIAENDVEGSATAASPVKVTCRGISPTLDMSDPIYDNFRALTPNPLGTVQAELSKIKVFVASHVPDPTGRPRPHTGTQRGVAPTDTVVGGTNGGAKEAACIGAVMTMVTMTEQAIRSAATKRLLFTGSSRRDKQPFRLLEGTKSLSTEPTRAHRAHSRLEHKR